MGITHARPGNPPDDTSSLLFTSLGDFLADHAGVSVGTFTTTILDTTKLVTFAIPMGDTNYQVFIQPMASVGVSTWPSTLTIDGFTANLSLGVNATFAYIAVKNS